MLLGNVIKLTQVKGTLLEVSLSLSLSLPLSSLPLSVSITQFISPNSLFHTVSVSLCLSLISISWFLCLSLSLSPSLSHLWCSMGSRSYPSLHDLILQPLPADDIPASFISLSILRWTKMTSNQYDPLISHVTNIWLGTSLWCTQTLQKENLMGHHLANGLDTFHLVKFSFFLEEVVARVGGRREIIQPAMHASETESWKDSLRRACEHSRPTNQPTNQHVWP